MAQHLEMRRVKKVLTSLPASEGLRKSRCCHALPGACDLALHHSPSLLSPRQGSYVKLLFSYCMQGTCIQHSQSALVLKGAGAWGPESSSREQCPSSSHCFSLPYQPQKSALGLEPIPAWMGHSHTGRDMVNG